MVAELQHDALVFGVRVQRLVIVEARCVPLCGGDRAHAHTLPYTCPCALVLLRRLHNLADAALSSLLRVPACLSLSLALSSPHPHPPRVSYAPEIAGAMLAKQQASAVVAAREQIVAG